MRLFRNVVIGAVLALGLAAPVVAAERAIIVLDASGSMWAQIDGEARITIARDTLNSVLQTLPDDLELGFMAYGHREKGNCGDIEMLVEPAPGTAAAISAAVGKINPKGMTPLSDAVRLAAEDLRYTEEKATVILITDGLETCEVDPCALGNELEASGIDFTAHVLGFGLSDEEGRQVACLAENTGGKYLAANDGKALVDALTATVAQVAEATPEPAPEPEPAVVEFNLVPTASLSEGGPDIVDDAADLVWELNKVAADGSMGDWISTDYYSTYKGSVEPGDYIMTAKMGYASASQPISVTADAVSAPHFVIDGVVLKVHPRPSEGADVDTNAAVELNKGSDYITTGYGEFNMVVPAGELTLKVTIGEAEASETFMAKAGETIEKDVVVGVGIARFVAEYVAGSPVEDDIFLEIFAAKKALDGSRQSIGYGYGGEQDFELPAGDYVVVYKLDGATGEIPFSVAVAELTETPVVLNAGILAVTSPSDDYIEVFGAAKALNGNRTSFGHGFGPSFETTLPDGDYVISAKNDGVESETPVTINGGERFELTISAPAAGGKKK